MSHSKGKRQKAKLQGKIQNFEFLIVLLPFTFYLLPSLAAACPGCKEALFDPGQLAQKLSTAKGYVLSIGLLLSVPFALVATITALVVRSQRRHARRVDPTP